GGRLGGGRRRARERGRRHLRRGGDGRLPRRPGQEDREGSARPRRRGPRLAREDPGRAPGQGGRLMGVLAGKVGLVTGASRGIGRAIAKALAAEGAMVVLGARDESRLGAVRAEIEGGGGRSSAVALDVADRKSVDEVFGRILEGHGRFDILVNNAGITRDNLLLRMKPDEWTDVLATNLGGTFHCTQAALRPMLKQRA